MAVVVLSVLTYLTGLLVVAMIVVIWRGIRERDVAQADAEGLTALWGYPGPAHLRDS